MDKAELAIFLVKMRVARTAESRGHNSEEAKLIADHVINSNGIAGAKAMGTPEGSIITIIESYMKYAEKRCMELGGIQYFDQASEEALAAIEAHRSRFVAKGLPNYPKNIDDYVQYRINLEVKSQLDTNAESMGLDKQTIKILARTAQSYLAEMLQ